MAIEDLIRRLPAIIIALASAWVIIRRSEQRIRGSLSGVANAVEGVKEIVNHRTDQLLEAVEYKGVAKGMEKATEQAREDRREFKDALMTPVAVMPTVHAPEPEPEPPPPTKKGK